MPLLKPNSLIRENPNQTQTQTIEASIVDEVLKTSRRAIPTTAREVFDAEGLTIQRAAREIRFNLDTTDDAAVRDRAIEKVLKIHGALNEPERAQPVINIQVNFVPQGNISLDNEKLRAVLVPGEFHD